MNIKQTVLACIIFYPFSFVFSAQHFDYALTKKSGHSEKYKELKLLVVGKSRFTKKFGPFLETTLDTYEIEPLFEYRKNVTAALQQCDEEPFDACLYLQLSPGPTVQVNKILEQLAALTKSNSVLLIQLIFFDEFYESYHGWYADRDWRNSIASGLFLSDPLKVKKKLFLFGLHSSKIDRHLPENRKMIKRLASILSELVE